MRFVGSKERIAKDILPIILQGRKEGQWYVEPFAGGMNTICKVRGNRIANDANVYLIAMWRALTDGREFPSTISKEDYIYYKTLWGNRLGDKAMIGWVGHMASFNGCFFDSGYSGHSVKTSMGIRDYIKEGVMNIFFQVDLMRGVHFEAVDYRDLVIPPKSIIYLDPPHKGAKEYLYKVNHNEMWQWARERAKEGHKVYVSEYNAPSDFRCVWSQPVMVTFSQYNKKQRIEKLFVPEFQECKVVTQLDLFKEE